MNLQDGNIYALKILDRKKQPLKYIKREEHSNEILKNCRNVLKFYCSIDINEKYYLFALEKVDRSLEEFVKNNANGLSELRTWFFFSQIVEGLIGIHSKGVIHRDLKPENILLINYEVRIADFTTSKFIYDKQNDDTRLGTAGFIPPELGNHGIPNLYKYGYDIYPLGIILYFMKFNEYPDINNLENCLVNKECSEEFKDLFFLLTLTDYKKRISIQNVKFNKWFETKNEEFYMITKDNNRNKYNDSNYNKLPIY